MKLFSKAMTTTALVTIILTAAPKAYAMEAPENDQSSFLVKARGFSTSYEAVKFELHSTGLAQKIEKDPSTNTIKVITDSNANADYQLESNRFAVKENDIINIPYRINVAAGGIISLGLLNTDRNGWYGEELVLGEGTHEGIYTREVPARETETSLVFRNYHLVSNGGSGQSTFTISDLNIQKEKSIRLNSTVNPLLLQGENGKIKIVTNNNNKADYQLESNRLSVIPGDRIKIHYEISVEPKGIMSLGLLSTSRTSWYDHQEEVLGVGHHKGVLERIIPQGETETSLVFRNYHLDGNGGAGQTTFTIEALDIQREATDGKGLIHTLPQEIFSEVIKYCSTQDIAHLSGASKTYQTLCDFSLFCGLLDNSMIQRTRHPGVFDIKLEKLFLLMNKNPTKFKDRGLFTTREHSFMWCIESTILYKPEIMVNPGVPYYDKCVDSHKLELLNPEALVQMRPSYDDLPMLISRINVSNVTRYCTDLRFDSWFDRTPTEQRLYNKIMDSLSAYRVSFMSSNPTIDENYRDNTFKIMCIDNDKQVAHWKIRFPELNLKIPS